MTRRLGSSPEHREVALHRSRERRQVERLLHVIVCAGLQGLTLVLPLVQGGDHDDADVAAKNWMLLDETTNLPTVATRHHHIEENERRTDLLEQRQRFVAVVRDRDRISADLQILPNDFRVILII